MGVGLKKLKSWENVELRKSNQSQDCILYDPIRIHFLKKTIIKHSLNNQIEAPVVQWLKQGFPKFSKSPCLFSIKIFPWRPINITAQFGNLQAKITYIKTNTIFRLSKNSCIRIDKNNLGINSLFFYVNQKFSPQEGHFRFF